MPAINQAYWISPSGAIIDVEQRHINTIISHPDKFGLNRTDIEKLYKKYKEPMGHEGKAREEIMQGLLKKGWVRLRYIARNDKWILQTSKLSSRVKDYIFDWAADLLKARKIKKYSEVLIMTDREEYNTDIDDIISFKAFESLERKYSAYLVTIEEFEPDYRDIVGLYN